LLTPEEARRLARQLVRAAVLADADLAALAAATQAKDEKPEPTKPADARPRRTYRTATGTIDLAVGDVIEGTEGRGKSWQNTARLKVLYLIDSDSSVFARDLSTSKEGPWFTFCRNWRHVTEEWSKP